MDERELRFHGSEMADGKSIFEIKRKCTPEDIYSLFVALEALWRYLRTVTLNHPKKLLPA